MFHLGAAGEASYVSDSPAAACSWRMTLETSGRVVASSSVMVFQRTSKSTISVLVNKMLHDRRRAEALGYRSEARLRGLKLSSIKFTATEIDHIVAVDKPVAHSSH